MKRGTFPTAISAVIFLRVRQGGAKMVPFMKVLAAASFAFGLDGTKKKKKHTHTAVAQLFRTAFSSFSPSPPPL